MLFHVFTTFRARTKPTLILSAMLLFLASFSMAQFRASLFTRSYDPLPAEARKGLNRGQRLVPSVEAIREIYNLEPESFSIGIPLPDGQSKELVFYKTSVVSSDFKVTTSDGQEFRGKKYSGVHYQIRSGNQQEKFGGLSFTENEMMGVFSDSYGNWNIGVLPDGKGDYVIFSERDLLVNSGFSCGTPDDDDADLHRAAPNGNADDNAVQSSGNCKVVKMYFECDFKMYQDNGSSTSATSSRITSMFNNVQKLYSNEQVAIELDQVFVWTSTDPYVSLSPSLSVLNAFTTNRQSITQKLGHLVSTRPSSLGGIAWIDVVCNPAFYANRFGFSNIFNSFSAVPTYSWTIYCIAHEIGHNFGSKHTHWCGWTGGALDNCYATEPFGGVSCPAGPAATGGGTIMSYCHVVATGVNFNKGFGTQPGNKIRSGFSCITGSPVPPLTVTGSRSVCVGDNLSLSASSTASGATFAWTGPNGFTSTQQNPVINSVVAAANGSYSCSVTASGCTSDPKTISVAVNNPGSLPVSEGFTSSTFPPSGWRISNPDQDATFVRNTSVGGFGTSTNCMVIDNYNLPFTTAKKDTLFTQAVNLSGQTACSLTFDVAHAWNSFSHDTLCVLVSSNCGRTFQRLYKKSGASLSTAASTFNAFIPTSSQWRKETISLAAFDGLPQVQIAFAVYSGASNFLYIDNINVTGTSSGSNSISLSALSQSSFCPGQSFSVGFTPTGTFDAGNTYSVEMSNSSGSFTNPTIIGTGSSSPVSVTIPAAAVSGSGYRIRVTASSPSTTSSSSSAFSVTPLAVSAGADRSACSNGSAITLSGSPSGGIWSGPGVTSSGVFTPSGSLVGNQTLTYTASSGSCSGTDQVVITVNSIPTVNAGANQTTCSQASAFTLTGFSPAGGVWSGSGVSSSGTFTPSASLIGSNTLTYTYTLNGCTNTDTKVVTVNATVSVSAGPAQTVCSSGQPIPLSGTPSGGTWSGSGVSSSGIFTPSSALVGNNQLTYTVSGACAGNAQTTVTVTDAPVVSAGAAQNLCEADAALTLSQGTPAGGTWSGTGVSSGSFSPSAAGAGTYTLTYTVSGSCGGSASVQFTVRSNPSVTMPASQSVCANNPALTLSASPSGGTWTGSGVNGSGVFTPSTALTGTQNLTYSVAVNGCQGSGSTSITVNAVPVANAGADQNVIVTDSDVTLIGSPAGGTWSGTAVSPAGVFSPQTAGAGTYTLTYNVTANGCSDDDQLVMVVNPAATVSAGSDQTICSDASPLQLSGVPAGGTWSGIGVSSSGLFTPSAALIGTQTLTYTVSAAGSDEVVITVVGPPAVSAGADQSVCSSASDFTLSGTPAGGTWSGTGISPAGLVSVSALSAGANTFTYSLTESGCSSQDVVLITRVNAPSVNAGANQSICLNANPLQLSASPAGGIWSGSGVSSSGLFDPSAAGTGAKTLTYTVEGSIQGCAGSDQVVVTVKALPVVSAGADRSTCANSAPFLLTASPSGGSWSGSGVSAAGLFTPSTSLTGIQPLIYAATQNGCSARDTLVVTVNSVPVASAGADQTICTSSPSFSLSGFSPAGGVWTGPSFVSQSGQCTGPFQNGTYTLTYTVTQNGCTGSDQLQLVVSPAPAVNAGTNKSICANAPDLTLTGFSPAGGTWSGNGVSPQGVFSPSTSLVGSVTLTYTVVNGGCSGSDQITVTVKAIPSVAAGPDETVCASGARFKIGGFSPRGGKFTGPGVVFDSLYQPSQALIGQQTLTYSVTKNGCSNTSQKVITVTPSNTLSPSASNPASLCANSAAVSFACSPSGGIWKGSGISQAGLFTPSASLTGTRTLIYRLDQGGCRDSVQVQVQVNSVPVVNAGADISACSAGDPVQLTGFSPVGGTWSGQGVSAAGIFSPATVSPGNVTLTYTFTENGCSGSDQVQVNVSSSPPVNAGADRTICQNSESIQLSASPIGGTWSGTGVSSGGLFTPEAGMSGPLTLTYTLNQNGCTGEDQIQVALGTALQVNAGTNQSVCSNDAAFNLSGFSPAGGSWSGPGVSAGGQFNPASLSGNQTLTYRVTQANCIVSDQKNIEVKAAPIVSAGADQNVCTNAVSPQLSAFSPASGTWSGFGVSPNGNLNLTQAGTFTITYTATANGCSASDQKVLTIIQAPQVQAGPNQTICGLVPAFNLQGNSPAGGTWTGNGVTTAGQFTPSASMLGSTVALSYSLTQNGCSASDTVQILVLDIPSVVAVNSLADQACQGELINLSLSPGGSGSGFLYQWKKDGNDIAGANAPSYAASLSGVYKSVISLASCSVTSQEKTISFTPLPATPVVSQSNLVLSSSASSGNQWKRNGQNIAGATEQTYTVTQSGIYTVVVSNQNCASAPSNAIAIDLTPNQDLLAGQIQWQLYPNPARDRMFLSCDNCAGGKYHFRVLDATGRSLKEFTGSLQEGDIQELDIRYLPSGVYWIRSAEGSARFMKKIMIQ